MTNGMELVHSDDRRTIHEMVFEPASGPITRTTRIDVTADGAVLGNHYHPRPEFFVVQAGSGMLTLAPAEDPAAAETKPFRAGDHIKVPAFIAHTFVCQAGTVLVAITDWEMSDDAVSPVKLV